MYTIDGDTDMQEKPEAKLPDIAQDTENTAFRVVCICISDTFQNYLPQPWKPHVREFNSDL